MSSTRYDLTARLLVLQRELESCASDMLEIAHRADLSAQFDLAAFNLAVMASTINKMANEIRPSEAA